MGRIIVVIVLLLLRMSAQQGECDQVFESKMGPLIKGNLEYINILQNTNVFEEYDECMQNQQKEYFIVQIHLIKTPINTGFCGMRSCSGKYYEGLIRSRQSQLQEVINNKIFIDTTEKQEIQDIYVIEYKSEKSKYQYNWKFYITCIILLSLVLLGLIGSITRSKLLRGFSVLDNIKGLLSQRENQESDLNIVNGVKVILCLNILYYHSYESFVLEIPSNFIEVAKMNQENYILMIYGQLFCVDTFFMFSGFFQAFVFLQKFTRHQNSVKFYFKAAIHRILRLWPTLAIYILGYWGLMPYIVNGPNSISRSQFIAEGENRIWKNLIFIDNFYDQSEQNYVFDWAWYVSSEVQIYLASLLILIIYSFQKKIGVCIYILGIALSVWYNFAFCYSNNTQMLYMEIYQQYQDYMDNVYRLPWARLGPFFVGVLFGIHYKDIQSKQYEIKKNRVVLYILGISIIFICIYIPYPTIKTYNYYGVLINSVYQSTVRIIFVIGVMICLIPGLSGTHDIFTKLLSCRVANILGKLTYAMYLNNIVIIEYILATRKTNFRVSYQTLFGESLQITIVSLIIAFFIYVFVEKNCEKLQKNFLKINEINYKKKF